VAQGLDPPSTIKKKKKKTFTWKHDDF
jgi:hypothetical protein